MSPWFHDSKRTLQLLFTIQPHDTLKLGMHRIRRRWQEAKINNASRAPLHKDQPAEIAIARNNNTALLLRDPEEIVIVRFAQAELSCGSDVMAEADQEADRRGIDILVAQESHGVGAR
jgi:hypothetical protein